MAPDQAALRRKIAALHSSSPDQFYQEEDIHCGGILAIIRNIVLDIADRDLSDYDGAGNS